MGFNYKEFYWKIDKITIHGDNFLTLRLSAYLSRETITEQALFSKKIAFPWNKSDPIDYATCYRLIKNISPFHEAQDDICINDSTIPAHALINMIPRDILNEINRKWERGEFNE